MGLALVEAIAALGALDHEAARSRRLGKPDGYLERQVGRWRCQLESFSALDGYPGPEIPGVDASRRGSTSTGRRRSGRASCTATSTSPT